MSPSFITMQGHKYSHICNLWGSFLPMGMNCTTTNTICIPVGAMYLHARMSCELTHMSSIPMGAINFYMQECFLHSLIWLLYPWVWCIYMQECSVHSLISLLFPWVQCQSLKPVLSHCSQTSFVTVDDFNALYTQEIQCLHPMYLNFCRSQTDLYIHRLLYKWSMHRKLYSIAPDPTLYRIR